MMTDRRLSFVNGLRSFCEAAFIATFGSTFLRRSRREIARLFYRLCASSLRRPHSHTGLIRTSSKVPVCGRFTGNRVK
jgi:hypothetical protein